MQILVGFNSDELVVDYKDRKLELSITNIFLKPYIYVPDELYQAKLGSHKAGNLAKSTVTA